MYNHFVLESLIKFDGRNTVCVLTVDVWDTWCTYHQIVYTIILRRYPLMKLRNSSVSHEVARRTYNTTHIMAMYARANSGSTSPP